MGKSQSKNREEAAFAVGFLNERGITVGSGKLTISSTDIEFVSKSKIQEYKWSLASIPRYGATDGIFTFEAENHKGENGMYCFTSKKADKIKAFLEAKIAKATKEYQSKQ